MRGGLCRGSLEARLEVEKGGERGPRGLRD